MKNIKSYLPLLLIAFILVGCGEKKKEEIEKNLSSQIEMETAGASAICTLDNDFVDTEGYSVGSKFVIYADDKGIVTRIKSTQIASSNDTSILENLETSLDANYQTMAEYGGYKYNIKRDKTKLTVTTDIDYTKMDLENLAIENEDIAVYLNEDYQYTLSEVQKMYTVIGATCKEL